MKGVFTLISVNEKAFVAVLSFFCASSKAAVFNAVTERTSTGELHDNVLKAKNKAADRFILLGT